MRVRTEVRTNPLVSVTSADVSLGPSKSLGMADLADAVDSKTVVSLPNELLPLVYVRTLATKNDHFRRSYCQHGVNGCIAYAQ